MTCFVVTTSQHSTPVNWAQAAAIAARFACPLVERQAGSLPEIARAYDTDLILVVTADGLHLWQQGLLLRFHPGMATLRVLALQQGQTDRMVAAMDLRPGDSVLDCTLGLGADAIVASYITGPDGQVLGLESQALLALITGEGLAAYRLPSIPGLDAAMGRIQVVSADYLDYLPGLPSQSFDLVYFDPMFSNPVKTSPGINALRSLANAAPVSPAAIDQARRVARKRVVLKERRGSKVFAQLGLTPLPGAPSSRVTYGFLE